jgi:hypothetical protein
MRREGAIAVTAPNHLSRAALRNWGWGRRRSERGLLHQDRIREVGEIGLPPGTFHSWQSRPSVAKALRTTRCIEPF